MAIDIKVGDEDQDSASGEEEKDLNTQASMKMVARSAVDGSVMVFDHPDIDIILMPDKGKVLTLPKDLMTDDVYETQSHLFKHLTKKSADLSPVNTLPVLVPPCAAGAKPTKRIFPFASPKPVMGLPQYFSLMNCFLLFCDIFFLNLTSLEHFLHLIIDLFNFSNLFLFFVSISIKKAN